MRISGLVVVFLVAPAYARQDFGLCGTTRESAQETLFLHRQATRARAARGLRPLALSAPAANRDIGDIALIEDTDGVVARPNPFSLDNKTLSFAPTAPAAPAYRYSVGDQGYDAAAATGGSPLVALDDDDTRLLSLPFTFPFFGANYTQVLVNSDGNLTFGAADKASTDRSLGRVTAGPPRIAVLFDDLDPSKTAGGVRVLSEPGRFVVSWAGVPEYAQSGTGTRQTFQVRLYPDGRVQFSYAGSNPGSAVVGIAPGNLTGSTSLVAFAADPTGIYSAAVAERFGNTLAIDVVTAAQKFYQTHEDAYDYLVIYNNLGIEALSSAVAYENTVRSNGLGYGVDAQDAGAQYGSPLRLQAVLNMGRLDQYPKNPGDIVPRRSTAGDTPLTVLAHETGHLFLAFASVRDPNDPSAQPMLGAQLSHWSFVFNSEASLLEGERIADQGVSASPRFLTTDTVQGYAPLDQYLMGFRAPAEVPPSFVVTNAPAGLAQQHPARNFTFNGDRRDIAVDEVIQVMGRRRPDWTVAQRRFRFAFLLVVAQGKQPPAADLAQVDSYRQQFEIFYMHAASDRAQADTALKRSLQFSLSPAAGVVEGGSGTATLMIQSPAASDLMVQLLAPNGNAAMPQAVRIPAGATSASFNFTGIHSGVEEVSAIPADPAYETAFARVQVASASTMQLVPVSGDQQVATASGPLQAPIVVRLTDSNGLRYPGARITATPSAGGSVDPPAIATDSQGLAVFRWTPGPGAVNELRLAVENAPAVSLTVRAGAAVAVITAVQNGASFQDGIASGALETIRGANLASGRTAAAGFPWPDTLAGVRVLLNGVALPLLYASDSQINFYVPQQAALGNSILTVTSDSGAQATARVTVNPVQPGIFAGGVLRAGTTQSAAANPVHAGDALEIYCTGLGVTRDANGMQLTVSTPIVFISGVAAPILYSGLVPGLVGLYQVNVRVPAGIAPGSQPVSISVNLEHSNEVKIAVQ
ncbi:MAG: hypothetical protein C5B51_22810 [Terriglobia bacterium]|nr:MAG: hypothetical protein C5B51_22810 [Terriglobia bacterium]